jgi:nucleotidyltransferase substrate binding protein (TIGR01987 family)
MKLDLSSLQKAVGSLERAIGVATDKARMKALDDDQRDAIRAGVIQNFEFTYELCWKMLKRQLEALAASAIEIDQLSFRELIRVGAERGLVEDPERWFDYRQQRNLTSHTYDATKAESVFRAAVEFAGDARRLLEKLEQRNAGG